MQALQETDRSVIDLTTETFYKASQVATILQCSRNHVYVLINTGEMPSVKLGGSVRVPKSQLERFLSQSMNRKE